MLTRSEHVSLIVTNPGVFPTACLNGLDVLHNSLDVNLPVVICINFPVNFLQTLRNWETCVSSLLPRSPPEGGPGPCEALFKDIKSQVTFPKMDCDIGI